MTGSISDVQVADYQVADDWLPVTRSREDRYSGHMPDRLPASFAKAVDLMVKEAKLHEQVGLARELAAAELAEREWSAQRIADEFKAKLDERTDLTTQQRKTIGVSRSTIDAAIRAHRIRTGQA